MHRLVLLALLLFTFSSAHAQPAAAPAFTINDDQGHEISFPRHQDGVDIYFFWASWCPYCKALMPHLQSMLEEYGDQVRVYAFNIREDGDPRALLDAQGYDFTLIPAADSLMQAYAVVGTPGLFLVDKEGIIRLNLYQLMARQQQADQDLSHSQKAARKAPWWAAEIRQQVDRTLNDEKAGL